MRTRSSLIALLAVAGCSRASETPAPRALAEPARDAAPQVADRDASAVPDASVAAESPPPTPFTIVLRGPTAFPIGYARNVGSAPALVQRLPGGGLVVASELARARADGPGPLTVELIGGGMENDVFHRPYVLQGYAGMRWVWSGAALAIVVAEEETSRSGPRITSYKVGASGFQVLRQSVGYWSAVVRDGSVLALERTAYEVPNSSIYPPGSGYEQNSWSLRPARIAVLSAGPRRAAVPSIPAGVCPTAMSAAPDGTVVVTVEKCAVGGESTVGVLRFPPSATQAKLEWFPPVSTDGNMPDDVVTFAASASEIYVGDGDRLRTWDGKEWATAEPFPHEKLAALSRAPTGELWAITSGRLVKRSADGKTWSEVRLPAAPSDPLDEVAYAPPSYMSSHFVQVRELPEEVAVRRSGMDNGVSALSVDATAEEVLVLAAIDREALVLSTKPRTPIARIPSVSVQRARLAQTMKRRVASSPKDCDSKSFVVFPETTPAAALRAALGDAGAAASGDAGASAAKIGEGLVEGKKRIVVYGEHAAVIDAAKQLATLGAKRLCGPAVVDREL